MRSRPDSKHMLDAADIGFILAHERKYWPTIVKRLSLTQDPVALAVLATLKGRDMETGRLIGSTPTQAEPRFLSWGYNPATLTALKTDVALFQEGAEVRTAITAGTQQTTTTVNDTIQWQGTITATGTRTVGEVALFDASTQSAQAAVAAGGVVGSAVSTTLNTAATFTPGNNNYIQIRTEFMQVTAGSGSTALTVVRMTTVAANLGGGSGSISTIAAADAVTPGNPPGQTGTTGGSMFLHADHTPDGLNVGDSIQYTIKDQFT